MTALGIFLLIAGWTLAYTGLREPDGDIRKEIAAAFGGKQGGRSGRSTPAPSRERRGGR